jgi:hypothetical protein
MGVWMKNDIDQDRFVLSGLNHAQACRLVDNLKDILPGRPVWSE